MAKTPGRKRFPLWLHTGTGLWCKKVRGRFRYFGPDKEKALDRYERERKHLEEGREPPVVAGGLTVVDLVNHFLTAKRERVASGELTAGTWGEYFAACERVLDVFGKDRIVEDL